MAASNWLVVECVVFLAEGQITLKEHLGGGFNHVRFARAEIGFLKQ